MSMCPFEFFDFHPESSRTASWMKAERLEYCEPMSFKHNSLMSRHFFSAMKRLLTAII